MISNAGAAAVQAAVDGQSCVAVVLVRASDNPYRCETDIVAVEKLANHEKCIPLEWIDVENATMKEAFITYAKPLIQGELTPIFKDGLPCHLCKK